jgi:hypothetical protein
MSIMTTPARPMEWDVRPIAVVHHHCPWLLGRIFSILTIESAGEWAKPVFQAGPIK